MQTNFLAQLKEMDNYTYTENGAIALKSTGNKVLDAFGSLAAMRDAPAEDILRVFYTAFYEDQALTMRLLFYVRDIRGGQGARRVFRIITRHLALTNPDLIINNFDNFLFFGRGDDLFCLFETPIEEQMMQYVLKVLAEDLAAVHNGGGCSLLAKWMPSINSASKNSRELARKFIQYWGLSNQRYRLLLSQLRRQIDIVESYMSANEWDKINFENLPSRAAMLYSDAFARHCLESYVQYLTEVAQGESKINAAALFPVDIINKVMSEPDSLKNRILYDALWKALPDYFEGLNETGICVVDTSGSMTWTNLKGNITPLKVALSLGLYCADKAKGPFANHFITFSGSPELQEITGENIFEKISCMQHTNWGVNTNVEAVFDLILNTALANNSPQEDLPSKLYIISDMQFDACAFKGDRYWGEDQKKNAIKPETLIESMRQKYAENGYVMPALIFWNVAGKQTGIFQLKATDGQCCMVSGYSSSLFKSIIEGTDFETETNTETGEEIQKQKIDPVTVMERTLNSERYDRVFVGDDNND